MMFTPLRGATPDADTLRKEYNLLIVEVDKDGKVKSFTPDKEKFDETILTPERAK